MAVVYKYLSKNGISLSMPKMNTGIEVGGAGAGADRKFRRESMAKLNEFSRELRTFREVDLAGAIFLLRNYSSSSTSLRLSSM